MQRSAVSIPSNIAEGRYRGTRRDYALFLRIAFGSGAELETQIEITIREVMKMLNSMIQKLV